MEGPSSSRITEKADLRMLQNAAVLCMASYELDARHYLSKIQDPHTITDVVHSFDIGDGFVFLIAKDSQETLYVAIRGTVNWENWRTNAQVWTAINFEGRDGRVHCGFKNAADQVPIEEILSHKFRDVVFCGHSLGGAVAALATARLFQELPNPQNYNIRCITFGAPMFADETFRTTMERRNELECFVHMISPQDIVPRIFCFMKEFQNVISSLAAGTMDLLFQPTALQIGEFKNAVSENRWKPFSSGIVNQLVKCLAPEYVPIGDIFRNDTFAEGSNLLRNNVPKKEEIQFPESLQQHSMKFYKQELRNFLNQTAPPNSSRSNPISVKEWKPAWIPKPEKLACIVFPDPAKPRVKRYRVQITGTNLGMTMPLDNSDIIGLSCQEISPIRPMTSNFRAWEIVLQNGAPIPTKLIVSLRTRLNQEAQLEAEIQDRSFVNRLDKLKDGSVTDVVQHLCHIQQIILDLTKLNDSLAAVDSWIDRRLKSKDKEILQRFCHLMDNVDLNQRSALVVEFSNSFSDWSGIEKFLTRKEKILGRAQNTRGIVLPTLMNLISNLSSTDTFATQLLKFEGIFSYAIFVAFHGNYYRQSQLAMRRKNWKRAFAIGVALTFISAALLYYFSFGRGHSQPKIAQQMPARMAISGRGLKTAAPMEIANFLAIPVPSTPTSAIQISTKLVTATALGLSGATVTAAATVFKPKQPSLPKTQAFRVARDAELRLLYLIEPPRAGRTTTMYQHETLVKRRLEEEFQADKRNREYSGSLAGLTTHELQDLTEELFQLLDPLLSIRETALASEKILKIGIIGLPQTDKSQIGKILSADHSVFSENFQSVVFLEYSIETTDSWKSSFEPALPYLDAVIVVLCLENPLPEWLNPCVPVPLLICVSDVHTVFSRLKQVHLTNSFDDSGAEQAAFLELDDKLAKLKKSLGSLQTNVVNFCPHGVESNLGGRLVGASEIQQKLRQAIIASNPST